MAIALIALVVPLLGLPVLVGAALAFLQLRAESRAVPLPMRDDASGSLERIRALPPAA